MKTMILTFLLIIGSIGHAMADLAGYNGYYLGQESTLQEIDASSPEDTYPAASIGIETDTKLYAGAELIFSTQRVSPAAHVGIKYNPFRFEVGVAAIRDDATGSPAGYPSVISKGDETAFYGAVLYRGFELRYIRYENMAHEFNSRKQTGTDPTTGDPVYSTATSHGTVDKEIFLIGYRYYFE